MWSVDVWPNIDLAPRITRSQTFQILMFNFSIFGALLEKILLSMNSVKVPSVEVIMQDKTFLIEKM